MLHLLYLPIAILGGIAMVIAWIMILIHAFQSEWWKGLLCLLCWPYLVYYMFVEFQHENKGTIILAYWIGGLLWAGPRFLHFRL